MTQLVHWTQRTWTRPGIALQDRAGDYWELEGLIPTDDRRALRRLPAWAGPEAHDIADVQAMFYDRDNDRFVLMGVDASGDLVTQYADSGWSWSSTFLHTAGRSLQGLRYHNCVYWGGYLWTIDNAGTSGAIRRYPDYTTTSGSTADTTYSPHALLPLGDRMYMIETDGHVYRRNDADTGWDSYFEPQHPIAVLFCSAYREALLLVTRGDDGALVLYQVPHYSAIPSDPVLHTAHLVAVDSPLSAAPTPDQYAVHGDALYLAPAPYPTADGNARVDVYRYNGARTARAAQLSLPRTDHVGLTAWRGELILYALEGGSAALYVLQDGGFTQFGGTGGIDPGAGYAPLCRALGRELVIDTASGLYHAGHAGYQEGTLTTSWLDMGDPARPKRLERLVALAEPAASGVTLTLRYRVDEETAWAEAASATNMRRVAATDLGVAFHALQVQVALSGGTTDVRLTAVGAMCVVGE